MMDDRLIFLVLLVVTTGALAGCNGITFGGEGAETLNSYREVGQCHGQYVGERFTPDKKIDICYALLVSSVELRVFGESQTVTFFEEDLGNNSRHLEFIQTRVTALPNCKVVDTYDFACEGLSRGQGLFTNTEAVQSRRLSTKWGARVVAAMNSGWIKEDTLSFWESSAESAIAYLVEAVAGALLLVLVAVVVAPLF